MRALGFDVKKTDVLKVLRDYDREGTGKITFEDFNEVSKYIYYIFIAILMLFLVIFEDDKTGYFLRGDKVL